VEEEDEEEVEEEKKPGSMSIAVLRSFDDH